MHFIKTPKTFSQHQSSCLFPIVLRVVSHKLHKNLQKENRNRKACTSKNSGSVFFWILFQHRELVKPDLSKALSHIPLYLMTNNIFLCLRLYTQNNWATQDTSRSLPILLQWFYKLNVYSRWAQLNWGRRVAKVAEQRREDLPVKKEIWQQCTDEDDDC